MEQLFSKVIKRRNRPSFEASKKEESEKKEAAEKKKAEKDSASSSSEDEGKTDPQPEWVMVRDPQGNLCWQNYKTGQVTYGNGYGAQPVFNQNLAQMGLDEDDEDDEDDSDKKPSAAAAAPVPPIAVMHPGHVQPAGMGFVPSPVHSMGYVPSPVPYGMSPVPVYPNAPWNAMPVSPVLVQVPEYVKKQQAEALKAQKKKEEAAAKKKAEEKKKKEDEERKRIAAGAWEKFYTDDGERYWQHSVTGKKVSEDPYY